MNVFQDPTKTVPKGDNQIVRVSMQENEIAGRKSQLPASSKSGDLALKHVENAGTRT